MLTSAVDTHRKHNTDLISKTNNNIISDRSTSHSYNDSNMSDSADSLCSDSGV